MTSLSDDSAPLARREQRRVPMRLLVAGLALAVALMLAFGGLVVLALMRVWGGEVGLVHAALVLTAFFTGMLLLVAAGLGWHVGVRLTRQRLAEPLREARQQLLIQAQLQRDWQWATDAQHRLVRWQAPQGAPSSSWVGTGMGTQQLWERFSGSEVAAQLRARLDAHQPFVDLAACNEAGAAWQLTGQPCIDANGHFSGYLGTARPASATTAGAKGAAAAVVLPSASADADAAAEQASFSYSVSHDLRAPLRVVEGFARILKEDYGSRLDRVGNDHLDRVMSAAARMNSMIDALLSLSQLSTRPLASQPVHLSQLAGFILDDLRRADPQREVAVSIEPGLVVQGDPTLLRMVLENLLGNAWKYSSKQERAEIAFGQLEQGGHRVYVVRDNGAGFDMRFAERLFGVFQRLHSASDFQGTGVGLALVRRIVRRHGGDIWAESAVGEGARFYFTLG
ncbi:sensor histidine kinase [Roseateles sp. BYS87W]|uniref:histidine kinase n=1 Tax=Pelomonas baiyunensis TaxID=3299026 RepID=A0ABW7GV99_9BURK